MSLLLPTMTPLMFSGIHMIFFSPEIFVLSMTLILLLGGLFVQTKQCCMLYGFVQVTLLITIGLLLKQWSVIHAVVLGGQMIVDHLAVLSKIFVCLLFFFIFAYGRAALTQAHLPRHEFYVLALFSLLGLFVMISAYSLLLVFLGLALMSLPLYALTALDRYTCRATEAAMKYFLLGALASVFLLYGMSLLYGATHALNMASISHALVFESSPQHTLAEVGMVFIIAALAFKSGLAPFHVWVPDVYEGSRTVVTLLIATAPKIAVFVVMLRVFFNCLPALQTEWQFLLQVLALSSMIWGHIAALMQTKIKRLWAYASIANMGYWVLGLVAGSAQGQSAALFFGCVYTMTSLAAFGLLVVMACEGTALEEIEDLRGLNRHHPGYAFLMLIVVFSMAGIPPTLGFFAKLGVLYALIVTHHALWLATTAIVLAVLGAFYYLNIIKVMYFEEPLKPIVLRKGSGMAVVLLTLNVLLIFLGGLFPGQMIELCRSVF